MEAPGVPAQDPEVLPSTNNEPASILDEAVTLDVPKHGLKVHTSSPAAFPLPPRRDLRGPREALESRLAICTKLQFTLLESRSQDTPCLQTRLARENLYAGYRASH